MPFAYVLTNPGLESALKAEMQARFPQWRLSFSAKNFLTFKGDEGAPWPRPWLARSWGECLGKNIPVPAEAFVLELADKWVLRSHVAGPQWPNAAQLSGVELPTEAPSRAWLKIEEAIRLYDLPLLPGEHALEVGAAPGGAAWALLQRGLKVTGVDPALMDQRCLSHAAFTHLRKPFQELTEEETRGVHWWLSDLNLAPGSVLSHLGRVLRSADRPKGLILTLKVGKPEVVLELGEHERRVNDWGYRTQLRLLPSHHSEVLLLALK